MKKILGIVAAMLLAVSTAFAQTTVMGSRTTENVYVTVEGGVLSPFMSNNGWGNSLRPMVGIEVGKNITPVVGLSVEALGNFNTTGANTAFDQSNIVGNLKFNLSNWFGGYKGQPRVVEVSLVPGIGWGHNYGTVNGSFPFGDQSYRNYLTYNAYGQIDFNLGKARALQINIKPGVTWATGNPNVGFYKDNAAASLRIGITWKFGSMTKGSHNFVKCPYTVTKAAYDELQAKYQEALNKPAQVKEVTKEVPVEKIVEKAVQTNIPADLIVTFDMGSATLKAAEYAKLKAFVANLSDNAVIVTGSADSKTGTASRNEYLATKRAEVVASALKDLGIDKVSTSTQMDTNEVAEASRAAVVAVR